MGRRAVRRIDPDCDLGPWLVPLEELRRPWDSLEVFGRLRPLEIDVGCGKGLFLLQAAPRQPDRDFLGVEVSRKYARLAAYRLAQRDVANARIVCGDAQQFFREWLPDAAVAAVHVYFPDPWWKKRHHKRRIMNGAFLRDVDRALAPGGRLHFWTDVADYFAASLDRIASATSLDGLRRDPPQPAQHDMDYRTHFERRMSLGDKPVYRAEFRKAGRRDQTARGPTGARS